MLRSLQKCAWVWAGWIACFSLCIQNARADASLCGIPLPADKTLNARNFQLNCTVGVSHYIRQPDPYDYKKWRYLENMRSAQGDEKAQLLRQETPEPSWNGSIGYSTIEEWDYDTIEVSPDPSCPTEMRETWVDELVTGQIISPKRRIPAGRNGFASKPSSGGASKSSSSGSSSSSRSSSSRSSGESGSSSSRKSSSGSSSSGSTRTQKTRDYSDSPTRSEPTGLRISVRKGDVVGNSKVSGGGGYFGTSEDAPKDLPRAKKTEPKSTRNDDDSDRYIYKPSRATREEEPTPIVPAPPKPVYRKVRKLIPVVIPCAHPVARHASRNCSRETLTYEAKYVRPPLSEWSPKSTPDKYLNILPDPYTLLPGEIEDVQIFTANASHQLISPKIEIGDAWNEYRVDAKLNGVPLPQGSVTCAVGAKAHLQVEIHTLKRRTDMPPPNPLRAPLDTFGRPMDYFSYEEHMVAGNVQVNGKPHSLNLSDATQSVYGSLMRQLENPDLTEAGSTRNISDVQKSPGIDVATLKEILKDKYERQIRIQLVEKTPRFSGRDILKVPEVVVPADQILKNNSQYELVFSDIGFYKTSAPKKLSWVAAWFDQTSSDFQLRPGKHYVYKVSMKQNGIPFYKTDCPNVKDCYSKELELAYDPDTRYEGRGWLRRTLDFIGRPY